MVWLLTQSIAALATGMKQDQLAHQINASVNRMALDQARSQGEQLLQLLPPVQETAVPAPTAPHLGQLFDEYA